MAHIPYPISRIPWLHLNKFVQCLASTKITLVITSLTVLANMALSSLRLSKTKSILAPGGTHREIDPPIVQVPTNRVGR